MRRRPHKLTQWDQQVLEVPWSSVKHAATAFWSNGNVFFGVGNLSGSLMDKPGFGECQEHNYCLTSGGGIMIWDCFSGVGLRPLVPVKGNLNASQYKDLLDNSMLQSLWDQFGNGLVLFQHD